MDSLIQGIKERLFQKKDFQAALEMLKENKSVTFDGLAGGAFALFGTLVVEKLSRFLLVLTAKHGEVEQMASDLSLFTETAIDTFPLLPPSIIEEDRELFHSEDITFGRRLRLLREMDQRMEDKSQVPGPKIIVSSLSAILQSVPTRSEINNDARLLQTGHNYNREEITHWLVDGGFTGTPVIELPGEFSIRGHVLDIFPLDCREPIRIEFFGDEIESIRSFDATTQRSLETIDKFELSRLRFRETMNGSFIDHLPKDTLILFHETDQIVTEAQKFVQLNIEERGPSSTSAPVAEIMNRLYAFPAMHAVSFASNNEYADKVFPFNFDSVDRFCGKGKDLFNEEKMENLDPETRFLLLCQSESEIQRLVETFGKSQPAMEDRLFYLVGTLSDGFDWSEEGIVLLGTNQLFGRLISQRVVRRKTGKAIDSFLELSPGDLVIHVGHGLARFRGLKMIKKGTQEEEHLELEFADNTVIYVPTSRIKLVQRYVGTGKSNPPLAKLNSKSWLKQKNQAQEAVLDLAAELLGLQAARHSRQGNVCQPDSDWQYEFEENFPFQETDDQLTAIAEIKEDMENSRPMDRLLCGDVGFGKTELAIRAAFKAVDSGYQVAVLVPTTILAEQHFRVFSERTHNFPITLASLTRFTTKDEKQKILHGLEQGTIDIVIGTHSLTRSSTIKFAHLGLVIIDEEQRFGVQDKEQLKRLRNMVDILTMTATPIPRTLHFSLVGLRDISNLETPPDNRLPVETRVIRFDKKQIRKGILREISRSGQVYFLHNRVRDIDAMAAELQELVPEARIRIGHAQMGDRELEEVMRDFILHKFDVLVCTTIVESGLDIPNANTIFINKADRFGLAELHQLRGRVGRDRYQAYCYLLLDPNQALNPNATKRLQAIEENTHLGSGFNIAMRDLEIRGAGNILGTSQSGHIAAVGYEMYCDLLDAAVRTLKNEPQRLEIDVEVDLPGTAVISKNYISDQRLKIDIYRRMQRVTTLEDCQAMNDELLDRFGPYPQEVQRLLTVARIRVRAWNYRITCICIMEVDNVRYVQFRFKAEEFTTKFKFFLVRFSQDLRIIEPQVGCLPIPKRFLDSTNSDNCDKFLSWIESLLIDPLEQSIAQFPTTEQKKSEKLTKQPKKSPLANRLKQLRNPKHKNINENKNNSNQE